MVQTVHGRLNVSLGGWGGQRLIQAKTDPEKFRGYVRAVKDRGLNCVRPLFHPPNAAKANDANWAQCRHHYFTPQNAATPEKVRSEADWQLANTGNKNSAASAIQNVGCGFFTTTGFCWGIRWPPNLSSRVRRR